MPMILMATLRNARECPAWQVRIRTRLTHRGRFAAQHTITQKDSRPTAGMGQKGGEATA